MIQWLATAPGPTVLRYAIHGHTAPVVNVPMPLLIASEDTAPQVIPTTPAAPPPEPSESLTGLKRAVIVGVSKYSRRPRGDLEWCDEDATSWYNYLTGLGYDCRIFGDEFSRRPTP